MPAYGRSGYNAYIDDSLQFVNQIIELVLQKYFLMTTLANLGIKGIPDRLETARATIRAKAADVTSASQQNLGASQERHTPCRISPVFVGSGTPIALQRFEYPFRRLVQTWTKHEERSH